MLIFGATTYLLEVFSTKDNTSQPTLAVSSNQFEKIILFWTLYRNLSWIKYMKINGSIQCGQQKYKCFVSNDKQLFSRSSAVVFHGIAKRFFYDLDLARSLTRPQGQRWIFFNIEPPSKHEKYIQKLKQKAKSVFNWTMTYMLSSDIRFGYGEVFPGKFQGGYDPNKNYLQGRKKTAVAFISNCVVDRLLLIKKLEKYIDVDVYGRCGKKKTCGQHCFSLLSQYKFYLAFESRNCQDYLTEKTYHNAFWNGIVPVIISGADLSNPSVVPPNSFINGRSFRRAKHLADHLINIGSDPQLYNEFFKWKDNWFVSRLHEYGSDHENSLSIPCRVCEKLYEQNHQEKIYHDLSQWYSNEQNCKLYPHLI